MSAASAIAVLERNQIVGREPRIFLYRSGGKHNVRSVHVEMITWVKASEHPEGRGEGKVMLDTCMVHQFTMWFDSPPCSLGTAMRIRICILPFW